MQSNLQNINAMGRVKNKLQDIKNNRVFNHSYGYFSSFNQYFKSKFKQTGYRFGLYGLLAVFIYAFASNLPYAYVMYK